MPPRAEEQAAARSDSQGLDDQAVGIHQRVVSFSREERVVSVGHIQTVSFFTTNYGGMGRKGNGGRGGGRGASIFKPLPGISSVEVSVRKEEGKRRWEGAGDS